MIVIVNQSEGAERFNGCPGRDRGMDLCWEQAVVQTCWPLKINHAGLMPRVLSERKSRLEVRGARFRNTFLMYDRLRSQAPD